MKREVKKWRGTWPKNCDLCDKDLRTQSHFYDARIAGDPRWGLFCKDCFKKGRGVVATGLGQEYDSKTLLKTRG